MAYVGIPDAEACFSIMSVVLSKTPHSISEDQLRAIAALSCGYVGADLSAIVREAGTTAIKRWLAEHPALTSADVTKWLTLTVDDVLTALPSVRPSAMRSVFLDTPPIRYSELLSKFFGESERAIRE